MQADPSAPPPSSHPEPSAFREGQKLADCFALRSRVAGTGNREVWLATDEVLGKEVSLHFVPPNLVGDVEAMTGLRNEVKRNRQLIHPSILRVYELVEGDGWAAIAMDGFAGRTLASCLEEKRPGTFEPGEAKALLHQICATLAEAHRIKLIHGDLSPENIIVTNDDGRVLLANFGSSFRMERGEAGSAPTASDDIQAVGGLIFQLLAGGPPRKGLTLSQQRREVAVDGGATGREWDKLATDCLAENPSRRPDSIGALLVGLEAAASSQSRAAAIPPSPETPAEQASVPEPEPTPLSRRLDFGSGAAGAPEKKIELPRGHKPTRFKPMNLQIESRSDVASRRTTRLIGVLFALLIAGGMTWFFLSRPRPNSPQAGSEVKVDLAANLESDLAQAPAESSAVSPEPDIQKHPNLEVGTPEQNFAVSELPTVIAESQEVVPEPQPMSPADAMAESAANARAALVEAEDVFAERQHDYQTAEATLATVVREIDERNRAESAGSDSTKEERARKELEARLKSAAAAEEKARALLAEKESAEQKAETAKANSEAALAGLTSMIEDKATAFSAISKAADEMKKIAKKRTAEFDAAAKTKVQAGKSLEEKSAAVAEAKQAIEEDDTAKAARIGTPRSLDELQSSLAELKQSVGEAGVEMDAATEQQKQLRETLEQAEQSLNELTAPATGQSENELRDDQRNAATKALEEDRAKFAQAKADREKVEHPNTLAAASANDSSDVAFVNSLGMKFVSVGDVQFSVWLTRHRDFEQFARATELKSNGWSDPGFRQGPDHPVVMVSWDQAVQFCQWLTERERRDGMIKPNQIYRLPTDAEWSAAVGLSAEKGNTPETRDMGVPNVYPWGTQWPPPPNAGNYTGQETQTEAAIRGYVDGFAWTSPVGSFPPNKVGLFDMGGNVWEWCLDSWSPESTEKVLRGGSWFNGDVPLSLLSSCRVHAAPESSMDYYGFRVVLARNPNE